MSDDERKPPPLVAEAFFMTSIRCPNCRLRFEVEGNLDRELIACPSCGKQLTVRLR